MAINFGLLDTSQPEKIGNSLASMYAQKRQNDAFAIQKEQAGVQNELAKLNLQKGRSEMQEQEAWKNALRGVQGGDYGQAMPQLMQASPQRAMALQKQMTEQQKAQSGITKDQLDIAVARAQAMKDTMPALYQDPSDENAQAVFSQLVRSGVLPQEDAQLGLQKFLEAPDRREFLKSNMMKADQLLESVKPKLQTVDTGGAQQIVDMNDASNVGRQFRKSLSPAGAVQAQQNQLLRDLALQSKQLEVQKAQDAATSRAQARSAEVESAQNMLDVIDKAITHPGRETATGLSGVVNPKNYIPGTNARDFKPVLEQLQGGVFLQAYQNLKGGGQITEVEGKKAEAAIARLDTAQSDGEFLQALKDLRDVVQSAKQRMMGAEGSSETKPTESASSEFSSMPNPSQYKGRIITDTQTGAKYRSDGSKWVKE